MPRAHREARARFEQALDRAHRNLYWAGEHAAENRDPAAEARCYRLMTEILEMMQDSLNGTRRKYSEGAEGVVRIREANKGDVVRKS
jgi:hypothetical protein